MCHEFSFILSTTVDILQAPSELPKVTVIFDHTSTKQQMLAEQLRVCLEATGPVGSPGVELWPIDQAIIADTPSDIAYLFIIELDRPVLCDIDKELFVKVLRLLISAKKILWFSQGGEAEGASPKSRMIDGLSRVVSSENSSVIFTTLAIDSSKQNIHQQVEKIIHVLQATASPLVEDPETEYVELRWTAADKPPCGSQLLE